MTLAEVIRAYLSHFHEPADTAEHIAAAVSAHMLSEAVVERAARAIDKSLVGARVMEIDRLELWHMPDARAAIRAALGAP